MKIPKPTEDSRARFQALVPKDERVEVKPMFGNLGAFVSGNMFMGVFGADVGVKLSAADERALRDSGGQPFGPAERPMSGYVSLPTTFSDSSAQAWVAKSFAYVSQLPAKAPKKSKNK
ncbi:MAG: TfoX/Sxy family protein [Chloroflexi bacterium]|nr:TfoX/Sxy family protein [Chloroflexota bacterium]MBV9131558.1 TfoX/Sxy family protein [Chloroflexota bacterium]MBV9897201.1 TfoX/Sxy family protein [Chloroflexota bacterium]